MIFGDLLEHDVRPVVQLHLLGGAGLVVDVDLLEVGDEGHVVDLVVVLFDPAVALGGAVVVVEGNAGGDDVE